MGRPNRLGWAGTRLAMIAASAIAILPAGCGGSGRTATLPSDAPVGARAPDTRAAVDSLLAGIPQRGSTLGSPHAPMVLQYFADLQCPYCRRFTLGALSTLINGYVRTGQLKIQYVSLETATRNPETFRAQQIAALAAGRQNKMWNFIELFYREQGSEGTGYVTERFLQELAQQVTGLNLIAWTSARSDPALAATILGDFQGAARAGVRITPDFLFARNPAAPAARAIERLLRGGPVSHSSP
jgi:protein-disulfide isomerase